MDGPTDQQSHMYATKNGEGSCYGLVKERIYHECGDKKNTASCYKNLYKKQQVRPDAQKDRDSKDGIYIPALAIEKMIEAIEEKKGGDLLCQQID